MNLKRQMWILLALGGLSGCATHGSEAVYQAEYKLHEDLIRIAKERATNPRTGEFDNKLYMKLTAEADDRYIKASNDYLHPGYGGYGGYGGAITPAPPATNYGSSNPVTVITPTPGMSVMSVGGITTYQAPGVYCTGGYGIMNCY